MQKLLKSSERNVRVWQWYRESGYLDEDKLKICCMLRNKMRKATRFDQKCKGKEVADNVRTSPKTFWEYINKRKKKTTPGIADLDTPTNGLISNDAEKVEIFVTFFPSVFAKENTEYMPII